MTTAIFKPIKLGKEEFLAISYDNDSFVMDWKVQSGGKVPPHVHHHMDEHFKVTEGEILFQVNGKKIIKKVGEEFYVPKGTVHSVTNIVKGQSAMRVKYSPCADTHRMFEIIIDLDQSKPGSMVNMMKYFYLVPRLGLKEFSAISPKFVMSIVNNITTVVGKLSGWDKLIDRYK